MNFILSLYLLLPGLAQLGVDYSVHNAAAAAAELGGNERGAQQGVDVLRNLGALPILGQRADSGKMMMEIMDNLCVVQNGLIQHIIVLLHHLIQLSQHQVGGFFLFRGR